jgi:hypothetical protein
MFVGWDWASTGHDVTVIDHYGKVVDRWAPRHSEQGLAATLERLAGHGLAADLPVAIERTNGLVVDRLLAAGHPVVAVHPNAFTPPGRARAPRAPSPTPATATSSPTTCAPTGIGCRICGHWMRPPASCRCCPVCGMTTSKPRPRPATN